MWPGALPFTTQPFASQNILPTGFTPNGLAFRLRIRNAADSANDVIISSIPTDGFPYIAAVPNGDGQEIDVLTGAVRTGAYNVTVIDAVTGSDGTGTLRLVTNRLVDGNGQQQLLSRRAFLEVSTNGGATWAYVWISGYLSNISQSDAITYTFTVSDARRVEQNATAFAWGVNPQDVAKSERILFPQRGCLIGGPIVGDFGPTKDSGGVVTTFTAAETLDGETVYAVRFVEGMVPPSYTPTGSYSLFATAVQPYLAPYRTLREAQAFVGASFQPLTRNSVWGNRQWTYPSVIGVLTSEDGTQTWTGTLRAFMPPTRINQQGPNGAPVTAYLPLIYVSITTTPGSAPSANQRLLFRAIARDVSDKAPLYFDLHPVEVVTKLYDSVNIPYKSDAGRGVGSWQWMVDQLGPDTRLAARITEPTNLGQFLESAIFGPFGFSARTNLQGVREFILTRKIGSVVPTVSITTADVVGDTVSDAFVLDESTVCTQVRYASKVLTEPAENDDQTTPPPPDGIVESENVTLIASGDTTTFSTREVSYSVPGMVHQADSFTPATVEVGGVLVDATILGVEQEIFARFKRGAPVYQIPVLATSGAALLNVGDECLINVSYVPNVGYRIGESTVGARVAQVVRRDETPVGPIFKLVDSGPSLQLSTLPTLTIAASTGAPQTVARFTITNASTLNAAGAGVELEWATGSTTPTTNGTPFTRYATGAIPTAAVSLPNVVPGSRVHVRARSVSSLNRPSAWSAWASVTLTNWTAPSGVTIGTPTAESFPVSWTNGESNYPVNVYLAPGSTAPSDWGPYLVRAFPAGSTQTTVRGLSASTAYIVGVAHLDPATGATTSVATDTDSTSASNPLTAPAITWFTTIATEQDAQYPSGIALGLYAGNEGYAVEVQRAPNSGGAPGTWATIAEIPGTTTVFVDPLPSDGATRWYRARHIASGLNDGAWTPSVSGVPANIPPTVQRPPIPAASLTVNAEVRSDNYLITWAAGAATTVTVSIDGAAYTTPAASPITVTRQDFFTGADVVYTFKGVGLLGDETTRTIVVQRADPVIPNAAQITSASFTDGDTPGDGGGFVEITWADQNMPVGTDYDIDLTDITGDPITASSGSVTGVAGSPYTFNIALGNNAEATCTIKAYDGATLVAVYTFRSIVP